MSNNTPDYKDNLVFIEITPETEILKKQLRIAMYCLKQYAKPTNWYNIYHEYSLDECPLSFRNKFYKEHGYKQAQKALDKIKQVK